MKRLFESRQLIGNEEKKEEKRKEVREETFQMNMYINYSQFKTRQKKKAMRGSTLEAAILKAHGKQ